MNTIATEIFPGDVIREILDDGQRDRYSLVTQVDRLDDGVTIIFGHERQLKLKNDHSLSVYKGKINLSVGQEAAVEGW